MASQQSPASQVTAPQVTAKRRFFRPKTNWHEAHREGLTLGDRLADTVAEGMGSWTFIIVQTVLVLVWMGLNLVAYLDHWDPYPFILLNLVFSTQAAYAAPIIMQSQNRSAKRDREQAQHDYDTNIAAKEEIELVMERLSAIEMRKIDMIMKHLGLPCDEGEALAPVARKT